MSSGTNVQITAVELAATGDLSALETLYKEESGELRHLFLDILLYVPESCDNDNYEHLIKLAIGGIEAERPQITGSAALQQSAIPKEKYHESDLQLRTLTLEQFLNDRVRRIDTSTGQIQESLRLLKAFPHVLSEWRLGIIRSLSVLKTLGIRRSIDFMESLDVLHAIAICIGGTNEEDVEQILEDVLFPWANYKAVFDEFCTELGARLGLSAGVNLRKVLRILSTSIQSDMTTSHRAMIASGAMLACYLKALFADGRDHTAERQTIVAILQNSFKEDSVAVPDFADAELDIKTLADLEAALTHVDGHLHSLIAPSASSIAVLQDFIDGSELFGTVSDTVLLRFASVEVQMARLHEVLRSKNTLTNIKIVRQQLLRQKVLDKITTRSIESAILKTLLLNGKHDLVRLTYITASPRPLPSQEVERVILETYNEVFDNAMSISRKELGGASHLLGIIHPKSASQEIRTKQLMVDTLIELSAYKGALQAQPVQIKSYDQKDVLLLFSGILQETGNYKKHFRLLGLYQNLSLALGIEPKLGEFYALSANAALSYDDLEAALKVVDEAKAALDDEDATDEQKTLNDGDMWRLLYQVCRYPSESRDVIEKQLGLLGSAMEICPAQELHQSLLLFRRLNQSLSDYESTSSSLSEGKSDGRPPTFERQSSSLSTRPTKIEMPQWRLFEAAQAATQTAREYLPRTAPDGSNGEGRVRKRDQLAGLVGSGVGAVESRFTSGLGWILGANP